MEIITEHLIEGAKKAGGLTVIIDVFRAFTTSAYVMNNGAEKIIPIGDLEEAFELKKKNPAYIIMGERKGMKVKGFDYGNSPYEIKDVDFKGKTVLLTTSSGTWGIVNAKNSDEIILGSFVNVSSIINYIKKKTPETVTLVAMGSEGKEIADEDELCAKYIKESLECKHPDFNEIKNYLRYYKSSLKFFDKTKPEFPEEDFDCAMDINRFRFVLKVVKKNKDVMILKESVS